jgi:hypothetical protein
VTDRGNGIANAKPHVMSHRMSRVPVAAWILLIACTCVVSAPIGSAAAVGRRRRRDSPRPCPRDETRGSTQGISFPEGRRSHEPAVPRTGHVCTG